MADRATGTMRKLKTSFKHMDVEIFRKVYPAYAGQNTPFWGALDRTGNYGWTEKF